MIRKFFPGKILSGIILCFLATCCFGQQNFPNRVVAPLGSIPNEGETDIQDMFLKQEWVPGIVEFRSGRPRMQVPIIFDVDNDKLYYLENNTVMEFTDSVSQFALKISRNTDSMFVIFRSGYPGFQSNSSATFYEVLVDGNIQLLKCKSKSIYMIRNPDELDKKQPVHKHLLFAYLPDQKIIMVKKDLNDLQVKMPAQANLIRAIATKHNLKLKNEKKLRELFTLLNQPG